MRERSQSADRVERPIGRCVPVDAAKTFAIIGVLLIHASAVGGFSGPVGSFGWDAALLWGSVLRCAVPVFFLCSGALLLDPEREVTIRRVWTHYLPHILAALFFWAAAYEGWDLLLTWRRTGVLEAAALFQAFKNLTIFHHKSHLYYLHIMLLIYALVPVTRVFTDHATRRELRYFLLAWLVLGVFFPTFKGFSPFSQVTGIPAQWPVSMAYASVGYTVTGRAVARYGTERRPWQYALLYVSGLVFTFAGTLWASAAMGELYGGFLSGMAPGICAQAVGLYGWCVVRFQDTRRSRGFETVSRASFCIYLSHLFLLDFLTGRGLTAAAFAPAISIPVIAAALFAFGFVVWLILRRIPWVNRWLI